MPGIPYQKPYHEGIPFVKTARHAERNKSYGGSRWKALREAFMAKVENRLCARYKAAGRTELTAIVHHIKERTTHPELAYTMSNLEGICKG